MPALPPVPTGPPASASELTRLQAYTRDIEAGVTFLRETAETSDLVILLSGTLGVYKEGARVATIGTPGSYVGEITALIGGGRTASVKAETRCKIVWIPADKVDSFFEHSPELALKLARTVARRLRDTTRVLASVRHRNARLEGALAGLQEDLQGLRNEAAEIDTPARLKLLVQTRVGELLRSLPEDAAFDSEWVL